MKRYLPLLALAFAAPSFSSAVQAQGQMPAMPAAPTPAYDAGAMALLDQSAAAYKALNGLSMRFNASDVQGEKTTAMSGTIAIARPAKARISMAKVATPFVIDAGAKTAEEATATLQMAMARIPAGASVPLVFLIAGQNPLGGGSAFGTTLKWSDVKTLPDGGVSMTTQFGAGAGAQPIKFDLYFDPTDHLLRRVEAKGLKTGPKGQKLLNISTFSDVQINPTFASDTFTNPGATPMAPTAATPATPAKPAVSRAYWDPKLVPGFEPYALTGLDLDGKAIEFPAYKGKVVLLDFWATWCGPCVGELPNVLTNYKKYHGQGFDIVGISLDQDKQSLTDFIAKRGMTWPQLFDGKVWKNVNSTRYGVRAIPFTLLIGKDGKIAAINPRGEELEPALKKALAD